jgi:mono/diheme cytochrome c family protein
MHLTALRPAVHRQRRAIEFAVALLIGAWLTLPAQAAAGSGHSLIARGAYVARAADCQSCHTAAGGQPFAGGDALKTPFGTINGPNITPDTKTGIGNWTRAEFERALRRGVRKGGDFLYPAMPYLSYTQMTDADLDALWAYLRSIPAVDHEAPKANFTFPFDFRPGIAVWQALYFKPGRFQPRADKDAAWNRGAYLVNALGHCEECHTPTNLAQAPEAHQQFTGHQIEGWYAPDISNDPLSTISKWTVPRLAAYLKTGKDAGNTNAFGTMSQVVHESLSHLLPADLTAMAIYLKDQASGVKPQSVAPVTIPPARLAAGRTVYAEHCASCHRPDGRGIEATAPALAGNAAITGRDPSNVIMAMLEGFNPEGLWRGMASFAKVLDDQQIADVTNYVRTAWGNAGEPNANPWSIDNYRRVADVPPNGQRPGLVCPTLPADEMRPALAANPSLVKQAAGNDQAMVQLVHDYRSARPQSSTGELIEALSTAYCREVAVGTTSDARTDAAVAGFSERVATVLARRETRAPPAPAQ